jgi:hypothetical protein
MVKTSAIGKNARILVFALFVVVVFLGSFVMMTWRALPQGIEASSTLLDEEYKIELNNVGEAHITDTLTYDKAWFNSYGYVFEKYPFLLSRRYRDENDVRELQNFTSDVDKANYTITLSFDMPGDAYNKGDSWVLYGYPDKPKFENQGQFVFESEGTLNSEFTLWSDMHINTTTTIVPPQGAANAHYDQAQKAVVYELPYLATTSSNPLAANRALFIVLFVLLMIIGLGGAVILLTRKTAPLPAGAPFAGVPMAGEVMAPVTLPTAPGAPPSTSIAESTQVEGIQAAMAPPEAVTEVQQEEGSKFCKFCGGTLKHVGAKFCSSCGKEQT